MRVLSATDMLVLNLMAWNDCVYGVTGSYIAARSNVGCKIWHYSIDIFVSYAGYIMCIITLERIISLALPLKTAEICTKKHSTVVLIIILFLLCLIFISVWFSLKVCIDFVFNVTSTKFEVKYSCCFYNSVPDKIYQWLSVITCSLLPFLTLLISNVMVLFLFNQTLKNRRRMGVTADPAQLIFLTKLLITTSLSYLILTLPTAVYWVAAYHIVHLFNSYDGYVGVNDLWYVISSCLLYINHSINFFLYCIASKKFRSEFISMINCKNRIN